MLTFRRKKLKNPYALGTSVALLVYLMMTGCGRDYGDRSVSPITEQEVANDGSNEASATETDGSADETDADNPVSTVPYMNLLNSESQLQPGGVAALRFGNLTNGEYTLYLSCSDGKSFFQPALIDFEAQKDLVKPLSEDVTFEYIDTEQGIEVFYYAGIAELDLDGGIGCDSYIVPSDAKGRKDKKSIADAAFTIEHR